MAMIFKVLTLISFLNGKEAPNDEASKTQTPKIGVDKTKTGYPEALEKFFEAHGGLENWKEQRSLYFELAKPKAPKGHTIDLRTRKDRIEIAGSV